MLFYDGGQLVLTVEETETDSGILMTLNGELRSETAHHIQDELDAFTTVGVKVVLDFRQVTFAGASFFRGLLQSQKAVDFFRQGAIVLKNVPDAIYREMDETGMTELLQIED